MELKLIVNPLSVNAAYRGRRFKDKALIDFEKQVSRLLPDCKPAATSKDEVFVRYIFHLKNYSRSDTFNMEKTLTDMLVKQKYLSDDRYIRAGYVRKEKIMGNIEYIEILIEPYTGQDIEKSLI